MTATATLEGKVVAVTGAGRGIGREIALLCARQGAAVVVNDLGASADGEGNDAGPAEEVVSIIRAAGGKAVVNGASVADPEGAVSIIEDAVRNFGAIHGLVNNAGIVRAAMIEKMSRELWQEVIDVNLTAVYLCLQSVGRHMIARAKAVRVGDPNEPGTTINGPFSKKASSSITPTASMSSLVWG